MFLTYLGKVHLAFSIGRVFEMLVNDTDERMSNRHWLCCIVFLQKNCGAICKRRDKERGKEQ